MMIGEAWDQAGAIPADPVAVCLLPEGALHPVLVLQKEDLPEWAGATMVIQEEQQVPVPDQLQAEVVLLPVVDLHPWILKPGAEFLPKVAGHRIVETTAEEVEAAAEVVVEAAREKVVEELRAHLHKEGVAGKIPEGCANNKY
jgi:hypothetical protein